MSVKPPEKGVHGDVVEQLVNGDTQQRFFQISAEESNSLFRAVVDIDPTPKQLVNAITALPNITDATLTAVRVDKEVMKALSACKIDVLDLHDCTVTDEALKWSPVTTTKLLIDGGSFPVKGGPDQPLTSDGLIVIAKRCMQLTTIALQQPMMIDKKCAATLRALKQLDFLVLTGTKEISDEGAAELSQISTLSALGVARCQQISERAFRHLLMTQGPKELMFYGIEVIPPIEGSTSVLPNIDKGENPSVRSLNLGGMPFLEPDHLAGLSFPHLKDVRLDDNAQLTDEILRRILAATPPLRQLGLTGCRKLTKQGLLMAAGVKTLEQAGLSNLPSLTDDVLEIFLHLPDLKSLNVSKCPNVHDRAFANGVAELETLDVSDCAEFTDKTAVEVARAGTLKSLTAANVPGLTDKGLVAIAEKCDLEKLTLEGQQNITDKGMTTIGKKHGFKDVNLTNLPNLGDEGLEDVLLTASLETLKIINCRQLTREVFLKLACHPTLQILEVSPASQFSPVVLRGLQTTNPKLRVIAS